MFIFFYLFFIRFYLFIIKIGIVLEKFGTFNRILSPGIHWVWPFIEIPRKFTWKRTLIRDGVLVDEEMTTTRLLSSLL